MQKRVVLLLIALAILAGVLLVLPRRTSRDDFERAMTAGQGFLEKGDATNAISAYSTAVTLVAESIDAHLNLANAYLLAGDGRQVIEQCQVALNLDHNNPAAYYLMGCAYMRLNQAELAVENFQQSQKIDPAVDALNFQLGMAQDRLGHYEDAVREFETLVQFEPNHPSAYYQLSRLYQRAGRAAEAQEALTKHQQILAKNPNPPSGVAVYERCKYTQPRRAFTLDQPDRRGLPVQFVDATASAFGEQAVRFRGPLGVLDCNHDGRNSLFAIATNGFQVLDNVKGQFRPMGQTLPDSAGGTYAKCLVGDLNNDRFEDVLILGEQASHAFRFATNGQFREVTISSGLKDLKARNGTLADLDFTGKLDLLTVLPEGRGLGVFRNLGNFYFQENTTNSGLLANFSGIRDVSVEDWRDEDLPGVFVTRPGQPPVYFAKLRAGNFIQTNLTASLPPAGSIALGDFNNDLLLDLVLLGEQDVTIVLSGREQPVKLPLKGLRATQVLVVDYDNDGWLDLIAYGDGLRVWRNQGLAGFEDVTEALGLANAGAIDDLVAADFDQDGDTDLVASSAAGLRFWRNDGGNANRQLKLRLQGNRSNASGLGVRTELLSEHWRTIRSCNQLPLEIGLGKHDKVDVLKVRWFDLATTLLDVQAQAEPLNLEELVAPTGSCPYLYAWDGSRFRFVTDILGASPLGLPVAQGHYVEQDPEEYLSLGNEQRFPPKDGRYEIRITEELREVLYLDQAKLVAVDHPQGTLVGPTSKMHASRPFPPHELWTLQPVASLKQAVRSDGMDVTESLAITDARMVSPIRLREPQLRGLAEPFTVTMDFGELPSEKPLVLVLTGWLRFGGGMANIAASLDPSLPFPFPTLEVELSDGSWKRVPTDVGVPAGKTKTILVDLKGMLPPHSRRLRLSMAFELYWDSALVCERIQSKENRVSELAVDHSDLQWRGFSDFVPQPAWLPLTPDYAKPQPVPLWRRTPAGWCTRYGAVNELVAQKDDALVLLNGGDELALSFEAGRLPPKPAGFERDFFLYLVGWDKDADEHVAYGWQVEPMPFAAMDDQGYGRAIQPSAPGGSWIKNYNTRWVGPMVLAPKESSQFRK